jgi:DNA-binding NarL/FixJ family response regulator
VSAVAPVADVAPLSSDEARTITDQIKVAVEGAWLLIMRAYQARAWAALGYSSWDDYCTREFGTSRLRLPREERQEVVGSLRDAGLSIRAITAATGISRRTVQDDLREVAQSSPPAPQEAIEVTGTDGKTYTVKDRIETAKANNPIDGRTKLPLAERAEQIRTLAAKGNTSRQIAEALGIGDEHVRNLANKLDVTLPDKAIGRVQRIDPNRVVTEAAITLDGVVMSLGLVEVTQLDPDQIAEWATSLDQSLKSLNGFRKQLKEMTR